MMQVDVRLRSEMNAGDKRGPARGRRGAPTEAALVEALSRPSAYAHRPRDVELVRTNTSLVFLAGERVYKVKRRVDLGFVDYTTLGRRRFFCEEEVRLNRRLAPGVYLGVVPVARGRDGTLHVDGLGETVEVAVEMKRLPASRMLGSLVEAGEVDNSWIGEIASLLAGFHAGARTGPEVDVYGTPEAVAYNVRENFDQTAGFAAPPGRDAPAGARTVSPGLHAFLAGRAERFLSEQQTLLEARVRNGRIRDGHGDLHAGNICLTDQGIVIYDRIEFAPRFRCGDVASDLAFLAMDLDGRGVRGFSAFLVRRYAEQAGDPDLERLTRFYKGYRAVVRAKVASFGAVDREVGDEEREARRLEALSYFHLAASYELGPVLILTCGLPASGKSTVARRLAEPFEAAVLRSDVRRKQLAGLDPTTSAAAALHGGIYTPEMSERTYAALLAGAEAILSDGRSVVVDAAFARADRRRPFVDLAERLRLPWLLVETRVDDETTRRRMRARVGDRSEVSDADYCVYERLRDEYEPPLEVPEPHVLAADGGAPADETAERALDRLVAQVAG
jgi:aminoglycoside phosphotransferase family enzyme/predicted kinase